MLLSDLTGELPKWLKGLVLKTGRGFIAPLGFESLILRHLKITAMM